MPIWKPNTRKGAVFLTPDAGSAPTITTSSGKVVTLVPGNQAGGSFYNEGNYQWVVPRDSYGEVTSGENLKISHNGQTGTIAKGGLSYRGDSFENWQASSKGALGSSGSGTADSGIAPGNIPGRVGDFGVVPANISDQYPDPSFAEFDPISAAGYTFTDPIAFAKKYGEFNRDEILKNRITAKDTALDQLDTELKGLEGFAPAASALKRRETSLDNIFNQDERARAVEKALPGAKEDLLAQRDRANTYASGHAPDSIADAALELNSRSASADEANAGGFGATSSVARKESDLRSAKERIDLSKYGDNLITSNVKNRSDLLLPPTEYSDAGQQIRVNPEVGGGRAQAAAQSELNANTIINPTNALNSVVNQRQFKTNLEQRTNEFNASNKFNESVTNAGIKNQFSLGLFNYLAGYAGAVASATQTDINTNLQLQQQKDAQKIYEDFLGQKQKTDQTAAITNGITTAVGAAVGLLSASASTANTSPNNANPTNTPTPAPPSVVTPQTDANGNYTGNTDFTSDGPGYGFSSQPDNVDVAPNNAGADVTASDPSGGFDLNAGVQQANYTPQGFDSTFKALKATVPGGENLNKEQTLALIKGSKVALDHVGIHDEPAPGTSPQLNSLGKVVHVSTQPAQIAQNTTTGGAFVNTIQNALDPMGAFSKEDSGTLSKIGTVANDAAFISQLTTLAQRGDQAGFITAVGSKVAPAIINQSSLSADNKAGLQAAATAASVFQNWGNMSPAQKSLAVAQIGLQGYRFASGESLGEKVIPGTQINNSPGMTVGEGLGLLSQGVNVYGLVKNWGQMSDVNRIIGGTQTATGLAQTAQHFGLIGNGTNGAAVATSAPALANSGYTASSAYGIGALTGPANAAVPAGYTAIGQEVSGKLIIVPTANAGSSAIATQGAEAGTEAAASTTAGQVLQTALPVIGAVSVFQGARTIYQGWGKGDGSYRGPLNGAIGGAEMAGGLASMGISNPYLAGALIVGGALANSWGTTGKTIEQQNRDLVRDMYVKTGFADDKGNVTLADGSIGNIGMDGHTGERDWKNAAAAGELGKRKLKAYDNDFTNPLDFFSGMIGTALTRAQTGASMQHVDQVGRQLGNAALGNVGFGKDLTEENFNKMRDNMRLFYSKNGVKTLADGYALANQGFAEHRFNDLEHLQMQQSFDMLFKPDGYKFATQLAQGVTAGVSKLSPKTPAEVNNLVAQMDKNKVNSNVTNIQSAFKVGKAPMSIDQKRAAVKQAVLNARSNPVQLRA